LPCPALLSTEAAGTGLMALSGDNCLAGELSCQINGRKLRGSQERGSQVNAFRSARGKKCKWNFDDVSSRSCKQRRWTVLWLERRTYGALNAARIQKRKQNKIRKYYYNMRLQSINTEIMRKEISK
jgi:hypothetical protein